MIYDTPLSYDYYQEDHYAHYEQLMLSSYMKDKLIVRDENKKYLSVYSLIFLPDGSIVIQLEETQDAREER